MGERRFGARRGQERKIFAAENRDGGAARGADALGGRIGIEGVMRREAAPRDFAGEAQTVEQFGIVIDDALRQDRGFPRGGGDFVALQLLEDLEQAIDAVQLRAARHVLPAAEEAHEVGGSDGLDFLAQAAEGQAMNARDDAAMAEFGV